MLRSDSFWYKSDIHTNIFSILAMPSQPVVAKPVAREKAAQLQFQSEFLNHTGAAPFVHVLDSVPEGLFFLKDQWSRFVWVSQKIWQRFGLHSGWEVAGRTDYEFHPKHLADNFARDDLAVLRSGEPLVGRVEIWFNDERQLDWVVTTKFPVCDATGHTIGLLGMIQSSADKGTGAAVDSPVAVILKYVQAHYDQSTSVEELAQAAGLSPRQLLRTVRREFGISVHELVMKTRIQAASDALLRKRATIGGIASDFGFCDQSAFTRQFRKHTGLTPLAFLRKYGGSRTSNNNA